MSNSSSTGLPSLTKWQLAIILGTPVAAGLGYLCYKNMCKELSPDSAKDSDKKKIKEKTADTIPRPKTPLEMAVDLKMRGNEFFKKNDFDSALKSYTEAIETCPPEEKETLCLFYQNRAAVYDKLKQHENVIKECTAALELNPKYRKALIRRASSYEAVQDLKSALEDITAVCILDNFSDQSILRVADKLLQEYGKRNAKNIVDNRKPTLPSKNYVKTYLSTFSYDPVLSNLDSSTNNHVSDSGDSGLDKALRLFKEEKYDKVIEAAEEEFSRPEEDVDENRKKQAELLIATMNIFCDQRNKALDQLTAIIDAENVDPKIAVNALIKRAALYFQSQEIEKCYEDFEKAVKIDEDIADIYHHRGQIHILMNQIKDAKIDFAVALSKNPDSPIIAVQKCYIDFRYAQVNESSAFAEECLKNFKTLIDKYPKCVECYFMYAQVLMAMQDYENAEYYIKEASKIDPTNATLYVHRGLLKFQWTGRPEEGVEFIEKAIKLDDRCELAYETLGTLKVQNGNLEEAISCFEKALEIAKSEVEITHILSLKFAAEAQLNVATRFNLYKNNRVVVS
nr:PREDICTED: mitochondrial import receptor subunit TOM70 [Bemisia tabaci]